MFCIFLMSRCVYNLKKNVIQDYYKIIMDSSDPEYLQDWMDFDRIYFFNYKKLKNEVDNVMVPYESILDVLKIKNIQLIESKKFVIQVDYGEKVDLFVFQNIIEAWKFYNYIRALVCNAIEKQNSLGHGLKINLRILFDDTRIPHMENVFMILLDNYNVDFNRKLNNRLKANNDETLVNFKAVSEFYDNFLIAFYSMTNYNTNFDKLKVFLNKFHKVYLNHISYILESNFSAVC